jgi:hypothetical protein
VDQEESDSACDPSMTGRCLPRRGAGYFVSRLSGHIAAERNVVLCNRVQRFPKNGTAIDLKRPLKK